MNIISNEKSLGQIILGDVEITFLNNTAPDSFPVSVSKSWDTFSHFHFFYEIHAVFGADVHYFVNNTEHILKDGSFCVFLPGEPHFLQNNYCGIEHFVLQFKIAHSLSSKSKETSFSEYFYYEKLFNSLKENREFASSTFMLQCLKKAKELQKDLTPSRFHKADTVLAVLFTEIGEIITGNSIFEKDTVNSISKTHPSENENIKRRLAIEKLLHNSYEGGITYENVMKLLNLSKRQSIRVVKELTGMSLNELTVKQRIERSIELLNKTDMTLEEIAYKVGYSSYEGFFIAFKKLYGCSPSQYRSSLNKER